MQLEHIEENEILRLAASAERGSEHPIGAAIVQTAIDKQLVLAEPSQFEAITGQGIKADIDGQQVEVGKPCMPAK